MTSDMRQMLERALEGVNTWLATYADDLMDPEVVAAAHQRLYDGGGTLHYIATLAQDLREAIAREPVA